MKQMDIKEFEQGARLSVFDKRRFYFPTSVEVLKLLQIIAFNARKKEPKA